jgi:type II restriction/modification system DNA methylase subunit YeeA
MDTSKLKKFAQEARRKLLDQVEARLKVVLKDGSLARRENAVSVEALEKRIAETSEQQVIEQAAYTWFNRFCALRFMDVNRYTPVGTVSPADGFLQPEILTEAKQGVIDENWKVDRKAVLGLLDGTRPSSDPQQEAYRLLLVGVCNHYNSLMPFLFEEIADYTEVLMPDDLLSDNSVLTDTRQAMILENCSSEHTEQSVEVIGWLYQFYISEKKDDVFAALKKGKKITPESIPAATQLFTPHWIVRYLVENSLGRLWMLNHPDSKLAERMDYYIKPEEPEADFLRLSSPEEIKVCDPACGSGHMLTYAFDLLYAIYEEQGYQATEIPTLILTHNLFGIEIDQRAGALAAFALTMKAREKDRRFFTRKRTTSDASPATSRSQLAADPNICVLENIHFKPDELDDYIEQVGVNLFTSGLRGVLTQWEEADNFGSLIRPLVTDVSEVLELLRERQMGEDLLLAGVHQKVLKALRQANYLCPKYHVVVANPPYMGSKGMNESLKALIKQSFKDFRSDVYAAFVVRATQIASEYGFVGLVTPFTWMFLGSYLPMRTWILTEATITSLIRPEYHAFFDSAFVPLCAFTLRRDSRPNEAGVFIDLSQFYGADAQAPNAREAILKQDCAWRHHATASDFEQIPGKLIAYWISQNVLTAFANNPSLSEFLVSREGLTTGDNAQFLRLWHEVPTYDIKFDAKSPIDAQESRCRWFPHLKGGDYRKWAGNTEFVVDWDNDGLALRSFSDPNTGRIRSHNYNGEWAFQRGLTWSSVTIGKFCVRHVESGFKFDTTGTMAFAKSQSQLYEIESYLNSSVATHLMRILAPTMRFQPGDALNLPYDPTPVGAEVINNTRRCVELVQRDWDNSETSWGFTTSLLLRDSSTRLSHAYRMFRGRACSHIEELQQLEQSNNVYFGERYGFSSEISSEVAISEVTLTSNPSYRYDSDKSDSELEALLLADTMREFISYAVGCMLGRYSLDAPGLILANQGDMVADYQRIIAEKRAASGETREDLAFEPDQDNVIPILDGDWFPDDITERFKRFLKVTFGDEHFEENLRFLEDAIYPDNADAKTRKTVRDYFLKDFYGQHVKMYKKRPIYWLFSSPKGTFNALIYMHRYRPDTVSVVLKYLRDFQTKLQAHKQHLQSIADSADAKKADKTKALKEITQLTKDLKELEDYERKVIYPLASERREIDLDHGVKHNYPLFGEALKKIPGLDAKEDE